MDQAAEATSVYKGYRRPSFTDQAFCHRRAPEPRRWHAGHEAPEMVVLTAPGRAVKWESGGEVVRAWIEMKKERVIDGPSY